MAQRVLTAAERTDKREEQRATDEFPGELAHRCWRPLSLTLRRMWALYLFDPADATDGLDMKIGHMDLHVADVDQAMHFPGSLGLRYCTVALPGRSERERLEARLTDSGIPVSANRRGCWSPIRRRTADRVCHQPEPEVLHFWLASRALGVGPFQTPRVPVRRVPRASCGRLSSFSNQADRLVLE